MMKEFDDLEKLILIAHLNIREIRTEETNRLLKKLFLKTSVDYTTHRKNIPRLLYLLEQYPATGIAILTPFFLELYETVITIECHDFNLSFLPKSINDDIPDIFLAICEKSFKQEKTNNIRVGEFRFDLEGIDYETQLQITKLIFNSIENSSKKLIWDKETIQNSVIQLAFIWELLNSLSRKELLYVVGGQILDRISSSGHNQLERDLAEEILIVSYKDDMSYLGFYNSFKAYSNTHSYTASLTYGCFCLLKAIEENKISKKFLYDLVSQSIKVFRGMDLYDLSFSIYNDAPKQIFNEYENRALDHTYCNCLLKTGKYNECHDKVNDCLSNYRESIIAGGINEVKPWLVMIYNLKRVLPDSVFSLSVYPYYLEIFESIVPFEYISPIREITLGEPSLLKPLIKESLIKLAQTRNTSDVVKDNSTPILMANRVIEKAVIQKDYESLFLASILKTDISLSFMGKESEQVIPISIPTINEEEFEKIYGKHEDKLKQLIIKGNFYLIWLLTAEHALYQMSLINGILSAQKLKDWRHLEFMDIKNNGFFASIIFDDTIKIGNEVRNVLPEEHIQDSKKYVDYFSFAKLNILENELPLLFINDITISSFPHNLFLDENGELIHLKRPVCNILSTEWFVKEKNNYLSEQFTKSIWIPTEGGDFTINQLKSKLESVLEKEDFKITESLLPEQPINSDINILSSHGDSSIALKQAIYPDENPRINIDSYIGQGKLLIFFVCHSGSMTPTPFENSISSIVKGFLNQGYSSIIAPFWSLHINLASPWLDVLLSSLREGDEIIFAVHKANLKVYELYPTIAAWACMHLYGDPSLRIRHT